MDCSPPDSSIYGIFQIRILEWPQLFPMCRGDEDVINFCFSPVELLLWRGCSNHELRSIDGKLFFLHSNCHFAWDFNTGSESAWMRCLFSYWHKIWWVGNTSMVFQAWEMDETCSPNHIKASVKRKVTWFWEKWETVTKSVSHSGFHEFVLDS